MKEFLASDHYEFIWHTTWNHGNNSYLASQSVGFMGLDKQSPAKLNPQALNKKRMDTMES